MIGRYKKSGIYKEIITSRSFIRVTVSVILIVASQTVEHLPVFSIPGYPIISNRLISEILLLAALFFTGIPIIIEAARGLLNKQINVDELVSIAIIACLVTGNFLEAAVVSTIMVAGAMVEEAVSDRARNAIKKLMEITPETAIVLKDHQEREVAVRDIKKGDVLVFRPGETICVDAVMLMGKASIDESSITGESIPVVKTEGDLLFAGTSNIDGLVNARAERVGKESTLGKIIAMVEAAESSRTGGARLVDNYAKWFTPVILAIAVITYLVTQDITRAITVLIVGCPCAFLLSGPVPTIATISRAARSGIMIKGGTFLEHISKSRVVFFDKTGTITKGDPWVTSIETVNGCSREELIRLAAAVEKASLHPLAHAIVAKAEEMSLTLPGASKVHAIAGTGIEGIVDHKKICISAAVSDRKQGQTVVEVSINNVLGGFITFADNIREQAKETITHIRKLGIRDIAIISGDFHSTVEKVAQEVGIDIFFSRLTPGDKYKKIEQHGNGPLVYIGDGINDAPALKKAEVGIAMGSKGADIALETADIVLMNDRLELLPFLISMSRRMTKTINTNIVLSFTINSFSIVAGFFGLLTPVLGALSHNFGSILVVLLSASLTLQKEPVQY